MNTSQRSVCFRAGSVWLAATAAVGGATALLVPMLQPATGAGAEQSFEDLLTRVCTLVLLGCAAWAWLVTSVVAWEAARASGGRRLAARRRGVPPAYRRFLLGACGVALSTGLTAPALATPGPIHLVPRPAAAAPHETVPPRLGVARDIVVRPGDSLWHLAAERLPRHASNATIAQTWHRLYRANAAVIGADPDRIEPGQRLAEPTGW
jgi:hypothetical protein